MTPTAIELWNDPFFLLKRIREQRVYLDALYIKYNSNKVSPQRFYELRASASEVRLNLMDQMNAVLNKI